MFPIKDLNRPLKTPHVNRLLLVVNIVIFAVYWLSSENIFLNRRFALNIEEKFVMIPENIIQGRQLYTLFTSMFMHAGLLHLFGNMLYLYIFGDNVEDVFGHGGYLIFYIISGLVASFTHIISVLFAPEIGSLIGVPQVSDLTIGVVGASGAISAVLGAYLVLYPTARILTAVFYGWVIIVPLPAIFFLGFWFLMQWLLVFFDITGGVAYWAHIGGFIAGMIFALVFGRGRKKARDSRLGF